MNWHPILFNGPMVRAILEGRKTQTRRVMSYQPDEYTAVDGPEMYTPTVIDRNGEEQPGPEEVFGVYGYDWSLKCPYGQPGDRLWVKETHYLYGLWVKNGKTKSGKQKYKFIAIKPHVAKYIDNPPDHICKGKDEVGWYLRPSIFMPRWASRIELESINIRAERLQAINRDDAKAEGVRNLFENSPEHFERGILNPYVANFSVLWDSINASRGFGWDVNPWVWVIEFKRIMEATHA